MTTPPAPEPEPQKAPPEKLSQKLPPLHVAAQVASTLVCALAASFLGPYGTVIGLAGGTLLSTTLPTAIEHFAGASGRRVRERYAYYRKRGMTPEQAQLAAEAGETARSRRRTPWPWLGLTAVLVAAASTAVLYGVESAAGKPVSYVVQGKAGHGSTFSGYTAATPAAPAPSPGPPLSTSSSVHASVSPSVSSSVPAAPGASMSETGSASPSGSVTVSPAASSAGFDSGAPAEGQ